MVFRSSCFYLLRASCSHLLSVQLPKIPDITPVWSPLFQPLCGFLGSGCFLFGFGLICCSGDCPSWDSNLSLAELWALPICFPTKQAFLLLTAGHGLLTFCSKPAVAVLVFNGQPHPGRTTPGGEDGSNPRPDSHFSY